jgi:hypothetical protein
VNVAASIDVSLSAIRHRREFPANATIASTDRTHIVAFDTRPTGPRPAASIGVLRNDINYRSESEGVPPPPAALR